MKTEHHPPSSRVMKSAVEEPLASIHVDVEAAASGKHDPMGAPGAWMSNFALFGVFSGLAAGGVQLAIAALDPFWVLFFSLLVVIQGALAGLAIGLLLRFLRGRVRAEVGLFTAVAGAWLASTVMPWALGAQVDLSSALRGLPYTAAVTVLIPLAAVLRARGRRTAPWMIAAGVVVGLSLTPWGALVRAFF